MNRTSKVLLWLAILCFIVGGTFNLDLIDSRGVDALYTILPLGAVFFGLFLISLILQKEGDQHPEDKDLSQPLAQGPAKHAPPQSPQPSQH